MSRNSRVRLLLTVSGSFFLGTSLLAVNCLAIGQQSASATLFLQVGPDAAMQISPAMPEVPLPSGGQYSLVRIDLAVRMNPGASATLWFYPAPDPSAAVSQPTTVVVPAPAGPVVTATDPSQPVLTADHSGRYSLTVRVPTASSFASGNRLELKSSDGFLHMFKTF